MQPKIENPEKHNLSFEPTVLAKPGKTRRLTGTGTGLACQEAAGQVL